MPPSEAWLIGKMVKVGCTESCVQFVAVAYDVGVGVGVGSVISLVGCTTYILFNIEMDLM